MLGAPMIGALEGTIFRKKSNSLILMVGGVGYRVWVTGKTLHTIQQGQHLTLFIHTHVREDVLDLFGFATEEELALFELLIGVSGVGPKTALLVLEKGALEIQHAVLNANVSFFTGIPRLGTKNAQKIIIELKNKIGGKELDLTGAPQQQELISALQRLGFEKKEIAQKISDIDSSLSLEDQVRQALKQVGKK